MGMGQTSSSVAELFMQGYDQNQPLGTPVADF